MTEFDPAGAGFTPEETDLLGAFAALGDAANAAGYTLMSPEELQAAIDDAGAQREAFPYQLSLEGFTLPRPDSWQINDLDASDEDQPLSPSLEELLAAYVEARGLRQLDYMDYKNLDEAIAVGRNFPRHTFYNGFSNREQSRLLNSEREKDAEIVGLTVVRLLITKDKIGQFSDHPDIDAESIYPIETDRIWGYDFARAAGGSALLLFVPEPTLKIPSPDLTVLRQTIYDTYYTPDGKVNEFAQSRLDPNGLHRRLDEDSRVVTSDELFVAKRVVNDAVAKAEQAGASQQERDALRAQLISRIFGIA